MQLLQRMIKAVLKMWRFLRLSMDGPKIHALEDHLMTQIKKYKGIGDFVEDFVEQSHQQGLRDETRTRGLDRAKAFLSHSNWEYKGNEINVVMAKSEMHERTKRKRKRNTVEKQENKKMSRDEKRIASLIKVESDAYNMIMDYKGRGGIKRFDDDEIEIEEE